MKLYAVTINKVSNISLVYTSRQQAENRIMEEISTTREFGDEVTDEYEIIEPAYRISPSGEIAVLLPYKTNIGESNEKIEHMYCS